MKLGSSALAALLSTVSTLAWAEPSPADFRTPEFLAQWGLGVIHADVAYAAGVDGTGVTIGIVDGGLDIEHSELAGRFEPGVETEQPWFIDYDGHGTAVAAVAVANRDGVGMHGVAPGAQVVMARHTDEDGFISDAAIASSLNGMIDRGVRIINNSYGDVGYTALTMTPEQFETEYQTYLSAVRRAVDSGALMIFITHNMAEDQPTPDGGLPHLFPELQRGWLAVTAVDSFHIADYANYCGVAMYWCLAAPGGGARDPSGEITDPIISAWAGGGYGEFYGTSYAAPHVAGAAALVSQMFPYMDAQQVGQVLLGTATDYGDPGVDAIWGYGLLNVGKAVMGPGRFDWGDFQANVTEGTSYWRNDIAGDGGLIKTGDGLLVLKGFNTYAGGTQVVEGGLALDGLVTSPVQVEYLGALMGQGLIGGNLDNAGMMIPGDARQQGLFAITGDYLHRTTGVLVASVDAQGAASALAVLGEAKLEGGEVVALLAPDLYRQDLRASFLLSAGGVSGRFTDLVMDDYVFLKGALEYAPDHVDLVVRRLRFDDPSVATSANQRAVGGEFERALFGGDADVELAAAALQQSTDLDAARNALGSLSGDIHATLAGMARDGGRRLARGLVGRMDQASAESAWIRPYGGWGKIDGDDEARGADTTSAGFLAGFDRRSDAGLQLGVSFGFDRTDADFDASAGKGRVETWEAAIYGRRELGALRFDGWAGYGRLDTSVSRDLQLGALSRRASADYRGDRFVLGAEAGRRFERRWGQVEPLAGLSYVSVREDGFEEEDAGGLGLAARSTTLDGLSSSLGVRVRSDLTLGAPVALDLQARWNHEFLDRAATLDARLLGVDGGGFAARGVAIGRDSAVLGIGASSALNANTDLRLDYDATLNADRTDQAVSLALHVAW
jgi:subtilase-type serine protease